MKVYISCHHQGPANELAAALSAAGHEIVSTWHSSTEPRPLPEDTKSWATNSMNNLRVIREQAEVLCLVSGPDKYPGGKFVEAGFAFGCGKTVVVVGRAENGILEHPLIPCCETVADAVELVSELRAS